jgi:NAD(P)-dependent dehydrogenase (short-subunit alcohol dehydrogenase family)/acyl carrier protein
MGRTGADRPAARSLVEHLERNGASVLVVTGDVSDATDVRKAVLACLVTGRFIGGVVQAALGLSEAIFSRMTNEAWHAAVRPKWAGTWHLHRAMEAEHAEPALDFFLLMSSVSGSVASNYCAANGFLDAWARWRRQRGQKAVSVGLGMISEVGYLHENPDIESLLLRRGIQPLDEEEFWQVVDLALSGSNEVDEAHWLTGLESQALRTLVEKGWDVQNSNMLDPRSAVLSASLLAAMDSKPGAAGDRNRLVDMPDWLTGVASSAARALSVEAEAASSLADAVLSVTRRRFSTLVPLPMDAINDNQSITQFGVDSMIAAEFRTWIWQTFGIDIPFLDLLNNHQTLKGLAEIMSQALNNQLL